jgi:hypothetical protein
VAKVLEFDRFWRATLERFLCAKAEKPAAETSTSGSIDAALISSRRQVKLHNKSFDVINDRNNKINIAISTLTAS